MAKRTNFIGPRPLEDMNVTELKKVYRDLVGEPWFGKATKKDILVSIQHDNQGIGSLGQTPKPKSSKKINIVNGGKDKKLAAFGNVVKGVPAQAAPTGGMAAFGAVTDTGPRVFDPGEIDEFVEEFSEAKRAQKHLGIGANAPKAGREFVPEGMVQELTDDLGENASRPGINRHPYMTQGPLPQEFRALPDSELNRMTKPQLRAYAQANALSPGRTNLTKAALVAHIGSEQNQRILASAPYSHANPGSLNRLPVDANTGLNYTTGTSGTGYSVTQSKMNPNAPALGQAQAGRVGTSIAATRSYQQAQAAAAAAQTPKAVPTQWDRGFVGPKQRATGITPRGLPHQEIMGPHPYQSSKGFGGSGATISPTVTRAARAQMVPSATVGGAAAAAAPKSTGSAWTQGFPGLKSSAQTITGEGIYKQAYEAAKAAGHTEAEAISWGRANWQRWSAGNPAATGAYTNPVGPTQFQQYQNPIGPTPPSQGPGARWKQGYKPPPPTPIPAGVAATHYGEPIGPRPPSRGPGARWKQGFRGPGAAPAAAASAASAASAIPQGGPNVIPTSTSGLGGAATGGGGGGAIPPAAAGGASGAAGGGGNKYTKRTAASKDALRKRIGRGMTKKMGMNTLKGVSRFGLHSLMAYAALEGAGAILNPETEEDRQATSAYLPLLGGQLSSRFGAAGQRTQDRLFNRNLGIQADMSESAVTPNSADINRKYDLARLISGKEKELGFMSDVNKPNPITMAYQRGILQ